MRSVLPVGTRRFRSIVRTAFAATVIAATPLAAWAQGAPAFPRMIVPASDGVAMRCGPGAAWYPVATLKPGTVLKADADVEGWLRVEYLPGMNAVVKADECTLKEADGKVVLSNRSRLRALSQADPIFDESFKAVFEEMLNPGLEMKLVGPIKNRTGAVAGYIVVPPAGAKGYVSAREVREAKPEEIAAAAKPVELAQPATPPSTPTPQPSAAIAAQPTPTEASPVAQPTPQPSDAAAPEPTPTIPAEPVKQAETPPPPPPPSPKGPTIRQLDRAFDDMMKQPMADADPQELIEQYNQLGDSIAGEPGTGRTLKYIDTRVQLLKLRQRTRDLLPEIQALEDATKNAADKYRLTIDRLIANREYKVVGRLYPSTVYDGTRLPQMYRLVTIDPGVKSTLAYVIPVPEFQLEQKVGAVVGILGEGKVEPHAMVEIVTPTTVDVLRPAGDLPPVEVP